MSILTSFEKTGRKSTPLCFIAALCVLMGASLVFPAIGGALEPPIGKVNEISGKATIQREGEIIPVRAGMDLYAADIVETEKGCNVRLLMKDHSELSLCEETRLSLNECEFCRESKKRSSFFRIIQGRIVVAAKKFKGFATDDFKVMTPTVTCGLRGTLFSVTVTDNQLTIVAVIEGEVEMSNNYGAIVLTAGEKLSIAAGDEQAPQNPVALSAEDIAFFESFGFSVLDPGSLIAPGPPELPSYQGPASPILP